MTSGEDCGSGEVRTVSRGAVSRATGAETSPGSRVGRRQFLKAAAGTTAGLALGAVGASTAWAAPRSRVSSRDPRSTATITVALLGANAVSEKQWNSAFAEFEAVTPGVKVKPLYVNANNWVQFFSTLQTRIEGGEPVDSAYIPTEGHRLFMSRGILAPLDSYIKKDKSYIDELYSDINPIMLKGFKQHSASYQGHTYYIPAYFNTTVLLYSRKLLSAANVPEPSADWNWDDFKSVAQKLSNAGQRKYAMLIPVDVWGGFEPWLTANGAKLLNDAWTASAINSQATVAAFTYCRSLIEGGMAPEPSTTANGLQLMASGNVAMINAGSIASSTLGDYGMSLSDVGLIPYPRGKGPGSSVGIGSWGMFKSSQHKDAVWKLIQWSTNKDVQAKGGGGSIEEGQLPIRTSASKSQTLLSQLPSGADYYWSMLRYSQFVPGTNNATAMEGEMDTDWSSMLTGSISPSACASQMAAAIKQNL